MTHGLNIFTRSLSVPTHGSKTKGFAEGNQWQYHPRSDRHSKILCWAIFFDLLVRQNLISRHIREEKISFGINHRMRDFAHNRQKDLDLVVCRRGQTVVKRGGASTFQDMAQSYTITLTDTERSLLAQLPPVPLTGVHTALIALEAKAAMTEFGKAQPRIYDELNSSQLTIHGDTDPAIAAGFVIVNASDTFISPLRNPWNVALGQVPTVVNPHKQPSDAIGMIEKIKQLPRRASIGQQGFDALGLALIRCPNDGTEIQLCQDLPSPQLGDLFCYDNFIERIETIYASRFGAL